MNDQSQAVYAAEDLWEQKEPNARIKFGDWNEIQPFYVKLAAAFRESGASVWMPSVKPRRGALKAHYDLATTTVFIPPYDKGGVWALNTATAIHEFAHHLSPGQGHGPKFREAMVSCLRVLGWDPQVLIDCYAQAGLGASEEDDGVMSRVSKIYAQADAPGRTDEEKKTFLEQAQRMAARHSIDLALLRKKQADADTTRERDRPTTGSLFSLMSLPSSTYRKLAIELGTAIGHAHGVQSTVRGKSQYLTFYGYEEDIHLTELMVTRVTPMMFEMCDEYIKSPERKASGVAAVSARITFCQSFTYEIGRRLKEAVAQTEREAVEQEAIGGEPATTSTALALRAKELEVADYVAHEFKRIGVRGAWRGSRTSNWSGGASAAGRSSAQNVSLYDRKELT